MYDAFTFPLLRSYTYCSARSFSTSHSVATGQGQSGLVNVLATGPHAKHMSRTIQVLSRRLIGSSTPLMFTKTAVMAQSKVF